jgi:hypothetical protein
LWRIFRLGFAGFCLAGAKNLEKRNGSFSQSGQACFSLCVHLREGSMKPRAHRETGQSDLFKARLDQIINMGHELVLLARAIDWGFLETAIGAAYLDAPGQPPLAVRLMAGLAILKHMFDLSDKALCGEEFFR